MRLIETPGQSTRLIFSSAAMVRARPLPAAVIVTWAALLIYLALLPVPPRVPGVSDLLVSVGGHFGTHAVLAALFFWLLSSRPNETRGLSVRIALIAAGGSLSAGVLLEIVQAAFTDFRMFEWLDVLTDLVGAVSGSALLLLLEFGGMRRSMMAVGITAVVAVVVGGVITSSVIWDSNFPYRGDHWHAQYVVVICGEVLPPFDGFYGGGLSSRGNRTVHLHPVNPDQEGPNPNLGRMFGLVGGELTDTKMTLPSGDAYSNGDACPSGSPGELRLFDYDPRTRLRGVRINDVSSYVPRNRQTLLIEFWTPRGG